MTSTSRPARPRPMPDADSRCFWDAAARGQLSLPCCNTCRRTLYPPVPRCPACLDSVLTWRILGNGATLARWTTVHADVMPGVKPPFIVAEARLLDAPEVLLVANVTGLAPADLWAGMALVVGFTAADEAGLRLPEFQPAPAPS